MERYTIIRTLAPAMYGEVLLARENATGGQVVIKKVNKQNARQQIKEYMEPMPGHHPSKMIAVSYTIKEDVLFELSTLQRLSSHKHPHLAQLKTDFEDREFLYIVMEYISGGELFEKVSNEGKLGISTAQRYMAHIASALAFMHLNGVCHRDVSLENLLVTDNSARSGVVLIDFGLGSDVSKSDSRHSTHSHTTGVCGKGFYIAPEVKAATTDYVAYDGKLADAWSAGVCLFMMLFGCPPVERPCPDDARFNQIARGEMRKMLAAWGMIGSVPEEALQVLEQLLVADPSKRKSVEAVLQMPWLKAEAQMLAARRADQKKEEQAKAEAATARMRAKTVRRVASLAFESVLALATTHVVQQTQVDKHGISIMLSDNQHPESGH